VALGVSILCLAAPWAGPATAYADVTVDRLAGADRYATMSAILDEVARTGGGKTYDSAVIATGQNYPDALAASGLAGLHGPIVLTRGDAPSPEARAQLEKLKVKEGVAIGGTSAISDNVLGQLSQMGIKGMRISGEKWLFGSLYGSGTWHTHRQGTESGPACVD
jgi:putative cell wall-binding protein